MRGAVLVAAMVAASGVSAFAADMAMPPPVKAPPPMIPVIVHTWTGCYIGGNIGAAWSHTDVSDEVSGAPIGSLSNTNFAGGGQIGCDYQFAESALVLGIQGMFDGAALSSSTTSAALSPLTLNGSIPWFATVTGRLGFAPAPDWLVYAKGGGAWIHTHSSLTLGSATVDSVSFDQNGWTVGGGVEWKFLPNWSVFAEYDYIDPMNKVVSFPNTNNIGNVHTTLQTVLVGVNLRFGGY